MSEALAAPALSATDFADFYRAVHAGRDPFPWQSALVGTVLADGCWPDLVDVPTGLGKTSLLDIAVFVAAATAAVPGRARPGRRRCFFVVDRRIVVDEAYEHADSIRLALEAAEGLGDDGVLGAVASALRAYAPDARRGPILPVTRMRGGATWSAAWLDRPDRPGLILGTVDQVGSRLLFRGYGVSDRRRPIDAALVGTDALVLVDEAHLADALLTTVAAAQRRDQLGVELPGLDVVRLTATGAPAGRVFGLDIDTHRPVEIAWRRLSAPKRLTVRTATAKDCPRVLADAVVEHLTRLRAAGSPSGHAPVAAVVCNTVDRARAVHSALTKQLAARGAAVTADCELLIGRSRPIDRPGLQQRILQRFGTLREAAERAAVLVATQTVEVGVNLDVDVLVTESASWDAVVQRLGRLNRLGDFDRRFPTATASAVVVHDGVQDGPVYGTARDATWEALSALVERAGGSLDVAPLACRQLSRSDLAGDGFVRASGGVPVLLTPTLDAWAQTAPVPMVDPPIEPFLHGFDSGTAGVQVTWREGLLSDDALDDPFDEDGAELAAAQVETLLTQLPPRTPETVEVPFHAVRQWMSGQAPDPVSDLDVGQEEDGRPRTVREPFRVLAQRPGGLARRRRASESEPETPLAWCWITAGELRPGDQIVVPVERGGLDGYGWAPTDHSRVTDVAERAAFDPARGRRTGVLRLDHRLPRRLGLADDVGQALLDEVRLLAEPDDDGRSVDQSLPAFARRLAALLPEKAPGDSGWDTESWDSLRRWAAGAHLSLVETGEKAGAQIAGHDEPAVWGSLLVGAIPPSTTETAPTPQIPDRDDEEVAASSIGTTRVTLDTHHAAVRQRAAEIALALGLPDDLRTVIEDAAGWHDLGKAEERFQIMLHGGDACEAALALEPLAKSGLDPADRSVWRYASRLSGLPRGARHEAWSVALVQEHLRGLPCAYPGDADLLLHLVASHHGYARPLARLVTDPDPRPVEALVAGEKVTVPSERTVALDQPARFTRLNQRYGRWGLALLESVVRCADVTVSEEGS